MKRKQLRKIKIKTSKKSNKHKKKYVRSRRLRLRLQKGGFRHDTGMLEALSITDTWSFINDEYLKSFQEYIFGTPDHLRLWMELLQVCKDKEIPVLIVTSGNLTGVIRTIQLLGLSEYVEEVISVREDLPGRNPNPIINPDRYFGGSTKADVIRRIMEEKGIPCELGEDKIQVAAFFDDQHHNFKGVCPSVIEEKVGGNTFKMVEKSDKATMLRNRMKENIFYNTVFKDSRHSIDALNRPNTETSYNFYTKQNFTSELTLQLAIGGITGNLNPKWKDNNYFKKHSEKYSNIKILFLDWDETVSFWQGPPDFYNVDFHNIRKYIIITPI